MSAQGKIMLLLDCGGLESVDRQWSLHCERYGAPPVEIHTSTTLMRDLWYVCGMKGEYRLGMKCEFRGVPVLAMTLGSHA